MNAPLNTQALSAVQVAEWKAQAALTGEPLHRVAVAALKARLVGRQTPAVEAWMNLSERTRVILLSMATDRATVDRVRWDQLTEDERFKVGAMARTMMRELGENARLLRA